MHKHTISKLLLIATDFITLFSTVFSSEIFFAQFGEIEDYLPISQQQEYFTIHFIIAIFSTLWFWTRLRHYTYRKPFWFELKEIFRTLTIVFVIELAIIGFSKLYISRYFWGVTWLAIFLVVPFFRVLMKSYLIRSGLFLKDTVIIGNGKNAQEVFDALTEEKYLGFRIRLFISTDGKDNEKLNNIPIARHNPELLLHIVNPETTQFIIAVNEENKEKQDFWLRYLMKKGCRAISVIPDFRGVPLYGTDMAFLFSHEMVLFRVNNNLAKRSSQLLKRAFDIVGSLSLLILLSPIFLLLYLIIKKDGGNAIYQHRRIGQYKKPFDCLKFRTMVINSKEILYDLLAKDPQTKKEWEQDFKLKNDPRITSIGKFLRASSLDELPQLWNVLKGEMSLVGPRPIIKEELACYHEDVDYYLMAKPGMTGLWQVSGRSNVSYETRVYFDTWYAKNWSLWNDIVILFKTIKVVLRKEGAC